MEFEEQRNRTRLLRAQQTGNLDDYVHAFRSLCLRSPAVDELTRTLLFVEGLRPSLKRAVLREHPNDLQSAIRAARTAADFTREVDDCDDGETIKNVNIAGNEPPRFALMQGRSNFLPPHLKLRLQREGRCFRCHAVGHLARVCPRFAPRSAPKADRL